MRRPSLAAITGLAWVGVVVAHLAAYVLAYPSELNRDLHLEAAGHSWVGAATMSVVAGLPVVILALVLRSVRSDRAGTTLALAWQLLAIQAPAFFLIELAERGWSVGSVLGEPAVLMGLLIQPLLATAAAWAVRLLHRAVRAVVARLAGAPRAATRTLLRPGAEHPPFRAWLLLGARRRAPPVSLCI